MELASEIEEGIRRIVFWDSDLIVSASETSERCFRNPGRGGSSVPDDDDDVDEVRVTERGCSSPRPCGKNPVCAVWPDTSKGRFSISTCFTDEHGEAMDSNKVIVESFSPESNRRCGGFG